MRPPDRGQRDYRAWASLPVVPMDMGYLQTIADLGEDRRLFVVYNSRGEILSTLTVDVPLGLMIGDVANCSIYGARRTNVLEIVKYSYAWAEVDEAVGTGSRSHCRDNGR